MARPRFTAPGKATSHRGRMRLWWSGRYWDLGPVADEPTWRAKEAELRALWARDPNAVPSRPDDYLISRLCRDYLESADSPKPGLQRDRVKLAVELLLELFPETTVAEFGPVMLRTWQRWLCDLTNEKGKSRFNVTTINYHVGCVRRIWRWGVGTERVGEDRANALAAVPRPKVGEARAPRVVEPADPEHVKATLPHLLPPVRAMVVLQLATGARPGELCRMTAGDVVRSGKVHVPGAGIQNLDRLGVWAYLPKKHKSTWRGKPRYLVFGPDSQKILEPYLDRAPDAFCFSPKEAVEMQRAEQRAKAKLARGDKPGGSRKPLTGRRSLKDHYDKDAYYHAVMRGAKKAGVPHWHPYSLRHAAAAELKELFGLDAVQALLGHHSRSMAEHYGGVAFKTAAGVARKRSAGQNDQDENKS